MLQHGGRAAYHITLIKRRALKGCAASLAEVWPAVLAGPPPVLIAKPHTDFIEATDPSSGTVSWIVELVNDAL